MEYTRDELSALPFTFPAEVVRYEFRHHESQYLNIYYSIPEYGLRYKVLQEILPNDPVVVAREFLNLYLNF